MEEAVEDRIGVGGIADNVVPFVDRQLAGDDDRATAMTLFQELQKVVPGAGVKLFKAPIVEDQKLDATQSAHHPRIAPVTARESKFSEEFRHTLIEYGVIFAGGFMRQR